MDFTKYHCPVCNKSFTENDDVVVCPECGTPHHRECYKSQGKCFNENLHGTNNCVAESFKKSEEKEEEEIPQIKTDEKNEENTESFFKISQKDFPAFLKISPAQDNLIEGKHSSLFEAAIGKNQSYYIPKFMMMNTLDKGFSLNFVAFLAPFTWSLYRKMYKIAALIFAAYALLFGMIFYHIYSDEQVITAVNDCYAEMMQNPELYSEFQLINYEETDVQLTQAQKNLNDAINKNRASMPMYFLVISYIIRYAPRVALCLLGNKLYMKKLCKNIDQAQKKNLEGDKLKIYLYKKYGTLPMVIVVIAGIIELSIFYI